MPSLIVDLYGRHLDDEPEPMKRFKLVLDRLAAAPKSMEVWYKRRLILVAFLTTTEFKGGFDASREQLNARERELIEAHSITRDGWRLSEKYLPDVDWCPQWTLERVV